MIFLFNYMCVHMCVYNSATFLKNLSLIHSHEMSSVDLCKILNVNIYESKRLLYLRVAQLLKRTINL